MKAVLAASPSRNLAPNIATTRSSYTDIQSHFESYAE